MKSTSKTFIFIRHGETNSSQKGILCGRAPEEPLNEVGQLQIKRLSSFLQPYPPDIIYTSPYVRARESTKILLEAFKNTQIIESEDLIELDFGENQGKKINELKSDQNYLNWLDHPEKHTPQKGESLQEICSRFTHFMNFVLNNDSAMNFIVTHGGPIRAALITAFQIPLNQYWNIRISHGTATCLEFKDNRFYLQYLGHRGNP